MVQYIWYKLAVTTLLLLTVASAFSETTQYYISPTGSDTTGLGTQTHPWQTIHKALFTIPFSEDDVDVNLREGTYVLPTSLFIDEHRGGSHTGTFRIKNYGNERVMIDGRLISDFSAMININGANHVTIEGLELTNLIGQGKTGIYISNSSNILIQQNILHEMHWTTDEQSANSPQPTDNLNPIVVLGNTIHPTNNISLISNHIYNLTTGYSEAIKVVGNVDGFLIDSNNIHDVTNICIVAAGNYAWVGLSDPTLNHARNGIILNNQTHRCISPIADSAGIYADGSRNIFIAENHSHHNTVGFSVGAEQTGTAGGIVLYKNTASNNVKAGLVVGTITSSASVDGVIITDNILSSNYTSPVFGGAPVIFSNAKNITLTDNTINSLNQFMVTANAPVTNLNMNRNRYQSSLVGASQAMFAWNGITGLNYTGFDVYRQATGLDRHSSFIQTSD